MQVVLTPAAARQLESLTMPILGRVLAIIDRRQDWPKVSGAKPLRGNLRGNYRIRTGDWRVLFRVDGTTVVLWAIDNRRDVYE